MSRDERTTLWCGVEWTSETRQHSETGEHLGVGGLEFSMEIALLAAAARSGVRAPRLPFPTSLIFDFILFFILSPSLSPHSHLQPITHPTTTTTPSKWPTTTPRYVSFRPKLCCPARFLRHDPAPRQQSRHAQSRLPACSSC